MADNIAVQGASYGLEISFVKFIKTHAVFEHHNLAFRTGQKSWNCSYTVTSHETTTNDKYLRR